MLFATLPHETRNAVRDLILTRIAEADHVVTDIKKVTSHYDENECKTVVRIQFKKLNREQASFGDLIVKLPGRVQVESTLFLPN
jgi:hypothetical protein